MVAYQAEHLVLAGHHRAVQLRPQKVAISEHRRDVSTGRARLMHTEPQRSPADLRFDGAGAGLWPSVFFSLAGSGREGRRKWWRWHSAVAPTCCRSAAGCCSQEKGPPPRLRSGLSYRTGGDGGAGEARTRTCVAVGRRRCGSRSGEEKWPVRVSSPMIPAFTRRPHALSRLIWTNGSDRGGARARARAGPNQRPVRLPLGLRPLSFFRWAASALLGWFLRAASRTAF